MRRNLDAAGGFPMAERVASLLAPALGRTAAHDLLSEASAAAVTEGRTLGEALLDRLDAGRLAGAGVTREQVTAALDPAGYLGAAAEFVDAALTAHAKAAGEGPQVMTGPGRAGHAGTGGSG
jgi:3-carboxy-cis,cis-muconate cycloisomerase